MKLRFPFLCALGITALMTGSLAAYTNNIMLTGYWPPTNEMVRPFSSDPLLNPDGWMGDNWEGRGYDIYSFFPEFTDYPNDPVGMGDFTVDYQDTSADWWRITDEVKPVAIITFSQTSQYPLLWEVEQRQRNLLNWGDDYIAPLQPTPAPPDGSVPAGFIRESTLPMQNIVDAVRAQTDVRSRIDTGFGGGFLSEYIAYHGTWYQSLHADPHDPFRTVAAGHIHVGRNIALADASDALEVTLRELITHVDLVVPEPAAGLMIWGMAGLWSAAVRALVDPWIETNRHV